MRIAVIGVGSMGFNHVRVIKRVIREEPGIASLEYVIDKDYSKAVKASKLYGGKPLASIDEIREGEVDLAFIVTPTSTHYRIACELIEKNVKYLFIEKPLTNNFKNAVDLVEKARASNVEISVGYIERFNPAVSRLLIETKNFLREPLTLLSRRIGPFTTRVVDTDVIYDLGVHEIDVHLLILRKMPRKLRAYGLKGIVSKLYDHAWINMEYNGILSSIEVNRITPFKLRKLYLTSRNGVAVLDYIDQELKMHREAYEINVKIDKEEPLYLEDLFTIKHFIKRKKGLIDQYQALTSLYLCEKSVVSAETKKEIVLEEEEDYMSYKDYLETGLNNYSKFIEYLFNP